jgi:hypothetical protein
MLGTTSIELLSGGTIFQTTELGNWRARLRLAGRFANRPAAWKPPLPEKTKANRPVRFRSGAV